MRVGMPRIGVSILRIRPNLGAISLLLALCECEILPLKSAHLPGALSGVWAMTDVRDIPSTPALPIADATLR